MKRKYLLISLLFLLTGCFQSGDALRSDIKEFVASFSLNDAMNEYLEAGYQKIEITTDGSVTKKVEKYDFNAKDMTTFTMTLSYVETVDDVETNRIEKAINVIDDKYIYSDNSGSEPFEITLAKCQEYITSFFYKQDTAGYHSGGMYYGDLLFNNFRKKGWQSFTTIDNESHIMTIQYEHYKLGKNAWIDQTATVNTLGMLIHDEAYAYDNNGKSISTVLDVYKK